VPKRLQHLTVEKLMLIARRLKPSAYAAASAATAPRAARASQLIPTPTCGHDEVPLPDARR
jgi:hypothetical protein